MSAKIDSQLAVALHYDRKGAPRVVAKGKGLIGEKIIEVAKANNIPIEENEILAGALSTARQQGERVQRRVRGPEQRLELSLPLRWTMQDAGAAIGSIVIEVAAEALARVGHREQKVLDAGGGHPLVGGQVGDRAARWIEQLTGEVLRIGEGSLYPALHRLEERGWVVGTWELSDTKRRTRVYRLTPKGRAQLRAESGSWQQFVEAVAKVLKTKEQPA